MNHNWRQLAHVFAVARMGATVQPQAEGSGYADVLVQVTLPIILFLELVFFLISQGYKDSITRLETLQGTETIRELDTALLDAQLQKILLALMQVEREEEDRLRLPYYRDKAAFVRLDPDFKEVCERSHMSFSTTQTKEEKATTLYKRVLELSQVAESPSREVRLLDLKHYITPDHASHIKSRLAGWLAQVESQVIALQLRIVTQLLQARVAQPPSELSAREQQLIDQLLGARAAGGSAKPYWDAFATLYVGKLQDQLVRDGRQFLPRTWQVLVDAVAQRVINAPTNLAIPMHELLAEMQSNPAQYVAKSGSYIQLKQLVKSRLQERVTDQLQQSLAMSESQERSVDAQWLESMMQQYQPAIAKAVDTTLQSNYDGVFAQARAAAVQHQWESMAQPLYPPPEKVELIAAQPLEEKALQAALEKDMRATLPLLEENVARVSQVVREVLQDAKTQLADQRARVQSSSGGEKRTFAEILVQLQTELTQLPQRYQPRPGRKIYEVFPSVQVQARERAQVLMQQKFATYPEQAVPAAVTTSTLEKVVRTATTIPPQFSTHLEQLVEHFAGSVPQQVLDTYVQEVESAERDPLRQELTRLLHDASLTKKLRSLLRERLRKLLPEQRNVLAAEEFRTHLPKVATWQWEMPAELLLDAWTGKRQAIDLHELPGPTPRPELLEETRALLATRSRELLEEGRKAAEKQRRLVDNYGKNQLPQAMRAQPGRSEGEWITESIKVIQADWQDARLATLWPDPKLRNERFVEKYVELFEFTKGQWIPEKVRNAMPPPRPTDASASSGAGAPGGGQEDARAGSQTCDEAIPGVIGQLRALAQQCEVPAGYEEVLQALRTFPQPPLAETRAHLAQEQQRLRQAQQQLATDRQGLEEERKRLAQKQDQLQQEQDRLHEAQKELETNRHKIEEERKHLTQERDHLQQAQLKLQSLRFFESGDHLPEVAQRQYAARFPQSKTRFVSFQVDGQNRLWKVREHQHKVVWRYYNSAGSVWGQAEKAWVIKPEWEFPVFSAGWGWKEAGHWPLGTYRIEVVLDGQKLAGGEFAIYEDRDGSLNQREFLRQAQERLKAAGCDPGPIDGSLGPRTKEALRCYQNIHRLPATGELDDAARQALGLQ